MKRVYLNLVIALRSLYQFKLRTLLGLLGVFLGTFSLMLVSNLSGSFARKAEIEIERLGKDLLVVRSGTVLRFGSATRLLSEATNLTLEDARAVGTESSLVARVAPSSHKTFPVRTEHTALASILVTGVPSDYPAVRNFQVKTGSFFSEVDDRNLQRVAVLGKKVADKLFGSEDPLGKHILIYRVPCRVIGVMEEKGVDISNVDQDNQVFVPIHTFLRRLVNQSHLNMIYVQAVSSQAITEAKTQIEGILRKRHRIHSRKKDDFTVIDLRDVMSLKNQAMSMTRTLGRVSAAIAFTIGGIGILSIMILIVNERRVEIGIRRAVGSRKRDIVLQFLLESSFISFLGGTVGAVAGIAVSSAVFVFSQLPFLFSLPGLLLSLAASVGVGVLAGIYPARKATTIEPMDVIRS